VLLIRLTIITVNTCVGYCVWLGCGCCSYFVMLLSYTYYIVYAALRWLLCMYVGSCLLVDGCFMIVGLVGLCVYAA